jgi:hypothetical protein
MAEELIQIRIEAIDEASKKIEEISKQISQLSAQSLNFKPLQSNIKSATKSLDDLGYKLKNISIEPIYIPNINKKDSITINLIGGQIAFLSNQDKQTHEDFLNLNQNFPFSYGVSKEIANYTKKSGIGLATSFDKIPKTIFSNTTVAIVFSPFVRGIIPNSSLDVFGFNYSTILLDFSTSFNLKKENVLVSSFIDFDLEYFYNNDFSNYFLIGESNLSNRTYKNVPINKNLFSYLSFRSELKELETYGNFTPKILFSFYYDEFASNLVTSSNPFSFQTGFGLEFFMNFFENSSFNLNVNTFFDFFNKNFNHLVADGKLKIKSFEFDFSSGITKSIFNEQFPSYFYSLELNFFPTFLDWSKFSFAYKKTTSKNVYSYCIYFNLEWNIPIFKIY